jgi:hypothetical protein
MIAPDGINLKETYSAARIGHAVICWINAYGKSSVDGSEFLTGVKVKLTVHSSISHRLKEHEELSTP